MRLDRLSLVVVALVAEIEVEVAAAPMTVMVVGLEAGIELEVAAAPFASQRSTTGTSVSRARLPF